MIKSFAVHSYKGGTGKTLISANLAAFLSSQGYKVCLLDFDFRAPSLNTLFQIYNSCWTNDLLEGTCDINETLVKYTHPAIKGELHVALSNPDLKSMGSIADKPRHWQVEALKRIMQAKKHLEEDIDFIIFDVTPGIEQIALNAILASDCTLTVLKPDNYGIDGTKQLISSVYKPLRRDVKLIENKCFDTTSNTIEDVPVIASIPCMCDVSKEGDKKIYTLDETQHPFSIEIARIAQKILAP